ncbi:hypothetical protein BCR36DRAFT_586872 [Piromyces finnis]|uniref:SGNH hydrolase-type esterase domain-containing protein n=1 Tax=Piromyces finnis TaxID=1754191 RepID=A0A1Y1UXP4_9FUNG|nr:hypothetical protein BCR36DRAFT_586872 [Piromyces finnis]|eukprot:ORX43060.1 hypothetical protein BCR36DRAFT_586872 [Piromyces finnis]
MTYTGKNCSGGKNWPLHFIDIHNMTLWNYGKGGSVINENLVRSSNVSYYEKLDFKKQYNLFFNNMCQGGPFSNRWNYQDSLFATNLGFNDVKPEFLFENHNKTLDIESFSESYFKVIEDLYNAGARNFLIFKIYPYCKACRFDNKYLMEYFNNLLEIKGIEFFENHPDTNIFIYNTEEFCDDVYKNCRNYGFKNCKTRWNWNKKKYMNNYFWRDTHITSLGNKLMAQNINDLLNLL